MSQLAQLHPRAATQSSTRRTPAASGARIMHGLTRLGASRDPACRGYEDVRHRGSGSTLQNPYPCVFAANCTDQGAADCTGGNGPAVETKGIQGASRIERHHRRRHPEQPGDSQIQRCRHDKACPWVCISDIQQHHRAECQVRDDSQSGHRKARERGDEQPSFCITNQHRWRANGSGYHNLGKAIHGHWKVAPETILLTRRLTSQPAAASPPHSPLPSSTPAPVRLSDSARTTAGCGADSRFGWHASASRDPRRDTPA